jgi:hypothetical protein
MASTSLGIPYPASTDQPRGWEQMQAIADAVNALLISYDVPVNTVVAAAAGAVSAGFTVVDTRVATLSAGKLVNIDLQLAVTATLTPTTGNLSPDVTCFTIAAAFRPSRIIEVGFDNGVASGAGIINPDGTIVLRTASSAVSSGSNVRLSATYILD